MNMLYISKKRRPRAGSLIIVTVALVLFGAGLYILSLVAAPTVLPIIQKTDVINPETLKNPVASDNRIIIPKIGVSIAYREGESALNDGAQWRYPDRGNPETGGNFILAAHRFTLASTPQETVVRSPFYRIDKLVVDDEIIVDYQGKRYGYKVAKIFDVKPTQVEIEAPSSTPKLTLYTCSLGGASDGRVVIQATPLGEVTIRSDTQLRTS